jgi:predicted GIY-YIG superfamily endonuclease
MGCVYLLHDVDNKGYIGSTINLNRRLRHHKGKNNTSNSRFLAKDFDYLILEEFDDNENMMVGEKFYIRLYRSLYGDNLLNKKIPLQTYQEYYDENKDKLAENRKNYYDKNRDKMAEIMKNYRDNNKDKFAERHKNYYEQNKDKIAENNKNYRDNNKERIKNYSAKKITCACGSTFKIGQKSRHSKSQKHQTFLKTQAV